MSLGNHEKYPHVAFPRQWFIEDGNVFIYGSQCNCEISGDGEVLNRIEFPENQRDKARVVARDDSDIRYTLGNIDLWVDEETSKLPDPPMSPVIAYASSGDELWRMEVPAGASWLLAGQERYVIAAGVSDQYGIRDGEVLWHLENGMCLTEPVLTDDGVLHAVCEGGGYSLVAIDATGEVVESTQLEYTDERMRFAFSPEGTLYAVGPGGDVDIVE